MLLALCHWEEAEDHVVAFRFLGTRLRFGHETVAEGGAVSIDSIRSALTWWASRSNRHARLNNHGPRRS